MHLPIISMAIVLMASSAAPAQALTRQDVVNELARARSSGELTFLNSEHPQAFSRSVTGGKPVSRSEVLAELARARANGELAALNSENAGHISSPTKPNRRTSKSS